jgi:hypothetical protein
MHAGKSKPDEPQSKPSEPQTEPQRGGFEREAYERDMLAMKEKYEKGWEAREQQHQDLIAQFKSALSLEEETHEKAMLAMREKYKKSWEAREQQHQDLIAQFQGALRLARPYVPVHVRHVPISTRDREQSVPEQGDQPSEPQRGGTRVEQVQSVAAVLPVPAAVQSQQQVAAPAEPPEPPIVGHVQQDQQPRRVQQDQRPRYVQQDQRPSTVPHYFVQQWSTGHWMSPRMLHMRLRQQRERQGTQKRARGCRGGRRGRRQCASGQSSQHAVMAELHVEADSAWSSSS